MSDNTKTTVDRVVSLVKQRYELKSLEEDLKNLLIDINNTEWVQHSKVRDIAFNSQYTTNVRIDANLSNDPEMQELLYEITHRVTEVALQAISTRYEQVVEELESINNWLAYK